MAESEQELKSLLMRVKEESEKASLKLNNNNNKTDHGIQTHYFMANRRGKTGSSDRLYFLGSKITVDSDCSHEIRRHLLLESYDKPRLPAEKQRHHLLTKVWTVKAMVSPVVMYRCESWTIKKAECQRMYAFELWCWRRLLRVPWTARRSNQSILKEINPEYSLEELMLKLKR